MKLLFEIIKRRKKLNIITLFVCLLSVIIILFWNNNLGNIIDNLVIEKHTQINEIAFAIGLLILNAIVLYFQNLLAGLSCETINHDIRMGYACNISDKDIIEIEKLNVGESMSKLQNELANVSTYISNNLFIMFNNAVLFIGTIIYLLIKSPLLTLLVNLPVSLIIVYVIYSSKTISKAADKSLQAKTELNCYADTLLTLFPIIKVFNSFKLIYNNYNNSLTNWTNHSIKLEKKRSLLMSLSGLLSFIPIMMLMLIGGMMAINNMGSIGTIYIFLNLSGNVSGVMMNMPSYITSYRQFTANMNRMKKDIKLANQEAVI